MKMYVITSDNKKHYLRTNTDDTLALSLDFNNKSNINIRVK